MTRGSRPLVLSAALAAAVRAAHAEGLRPGVRAVLVHGRRLVRGALRPGRRAALAAAVGCTAYGALKLYWALGGGLLLREAPLSGDAHRDLLERTPGMVALNSASAALAVIGIALAIATARAGRLPRLLVVGLPALVGGLMLARAALGAAGDVAVLSGAADGSTHTARWDLALWSPFFAAWGAAWGLAAVAARRRTAGRPTLMPPPADAPRPHHPRLRARPARRRARVGAALRTSRPTPTRSASAGSGVRGGRARARAPNASRASRSDAKPTS